MPVTANHHLELAERLVDFGRKNGADQVEVTIGENTEFSVDVREGQIEKLLEADTCGLSIKVIVDQRTATASSSDLSQQTLHTLMQNTIKQATYAHQDTFAGLPDDHGETDSAEDLKIYDPQIPEMETRAKIALAKEAEKIALSDKRVTKSHGSGVTTIHGATTLVNSKGFSGSYKRTLIASGVYLQAGSGDHLFDEGWSDSTGTLADLWKPEQIAEKAVHRVTRLIGATKIKSQNVPVVFEPRMTAGLLGFLLSCVSGGNIYMKNSFLSDHLGKKIAGSNVTVVDNGRIPGAPGTRPFDREGVSTRETVIIDHGELKNYLMDTYSARKLGSRSTGNASGANNLYLQAGNTDPENVIKSVKNGLLLTGTIGFGMVPSTGDISRGAFGIWIENGELAFPVAEITISGNLGHMLRNVEIIGNDLTFRRSITGPTIKISEITVGGK